MILALIAIAGSGGLLAAREYSAIQAAPQIYMLDVISDRPVAIVFGAQIFPNGLPSAMLADRVAMGVQLYKSGKVRALLLTGDNHTADYNEPEVMRRYALSLGVPDSALVLDYAGFHTYDSCYRARAVFKIDHAILVTQAFHLDRALLICNDLGVESIGVAADAMRPTGYPRWELFASELRELPSTAINLFQILYDHQPHFLGEPLPIFTDGKLTNYRETF